MDVITSIQGQLAHNNFAFVPARCMRSILYEYAKFSEQDEDQFCRFWNHAVPQKDENEQVIYPFKGTLVSYYSMDIGEKFKNSHRRMTCYNLKNDLENRSFEYIDPTTVGKESKFRSHRQWPIEADTNPVFLGLQRVLFDVISKPCSLDWHPMNGTDPTSSVYENMTTAFRVTKSFNLSNDRMSIYNLGDPGPEGIHQDICDLTVIVLVNRKNVLEESAGNRVWSLDQNCGKPTESDINSDRLLKELVLKNTFDSLFLLDKEVKHEVLPIRYSGGNSISNNENKISIRDVLTFNARRVRPITNDTCNDARCV